MGTNDIQLPWLHTWASNTSKCHSHTRGHQPNPTGTTRFVSTNHIQLPMTTHLGNQSHRTATTTHAGTNHIQLAQPTSWVPISSNCHATHFGIKHIQLPQDVFDAQVCSHHTRGHQPHPTGTTKLVEPHTRAPTHPTGTTRFVSTNHIQLPCPHT